MKRLAKIFIIYILIHSTIGENPSTMPGTLSTTRRFFSTNNSAASSITSRITAYTPLIPPSTTTRDTTRSATITPYTTTSTTEPPSTTRSTTTTDTTSTTTELPNIPLSTTTPSTTTASTSTTPSTTTATTTTTTEPPSTTWSTTTSTTTTTTEPASTTRFPTSTGRPPIAQIGTWGVNFSTSDSACIFLEMAASVEFYYTNMWDEIDKGYINVPAEAESIGTCEESGRHRQSIKLTWRVNSFSTNSLEFVFRKNDHMCELNRITFNFTFDPENFPMAKDAYQNLLLVNKNVHFITPETRSYICGRQHVIPLHVSGRNVDIGKIKISDLHFQAFGHISNGHLLKAMSCQNPHVTSWLYFLIGALVALIAVIIFLYVLDKKGHPFPGYLAMTNKDQCEADRLQIYLDTKRNPQMINGIQFRRSIIEEIVG